MDIKIHFHFLLQILILLIEMDYFLLISFLEGLNNFFDIFQINKIIHEFSSGKYLEWSRFIF